MKIAPSTYYAHLSCPVSSTVLDGAYLVNALVTLHRANVGAYGVANVTEKGSRSAGTRWPG